MERTLIEVEVAVGEVVEGAEGPMRLHKRRTGAGLKGRSIRDMLDEEAVVGGDKSEGGDQ